MACLVYVVHSMSLEMQTIRKCKLLKLETNSKKLMIGSKSRQHRHWKQMSKSRDICLICLHASGFCIVGWDTILSLQFFILERAVNSNVEGMIRHQ